MQKLLCLAVVICAMEAVAQGLALKQGAEAAVFGDNDSKVSFSSKDGSMLGIILDGTVCAVPAPRTDELWLDICSNDHRWLDKSIPWQMRGIQTTADTIRLDLWHENWEVRAYTQFLPQKKQLRRWFEIAWQGTETVKIYQMRFHWPKLALTTKSNYFMPAASGDCRKYHYGDFKDHARHSVSANNETTIFEVTPEHSLVFLMNELVEYSDSGNCVVIHHDDWVDVSHESNIQGYMKPGIFQKVGDFWLWSQRNDGEQALLRLHEWHREHGFVPPKDRPDWVQRATLYSFHPQGINGDLGGFVPATKLLTQIRDLGCNTVWVLPIQDKSSYWPRDYFALQEGIGTVEEGKKLFETGHKLGMRMWLDNVPHGGSNEYQRNIDHPEWLLQQEDGSTLYYWCNDFNWPTWIDYMRGVSRFFLETYDLDGFRIDACSGSKTANWNPNIPYGRASFALRQGGFNMQRAIRKEVKAYRRDGAILAEVGNNVFGTTADCIYDFTLCYDALPRFRNMPPAQFVSNFRRWLHEQQYVQIPGQIRLRHIESHDSLRSEYWYGPQGMRAMMAISSWIYGIPMVFYDMENGHRSAFKKIFAIRNSLKEIGDGSEDTLCVKAPDGVFAVLRKTEQSATPPEVYAWDAGAGPRACIALVNLNADKVTAKIAVPVASMPEFAASTSCQELWTGGKLPVERHGDQLEIPVALDGFGCAVLRFGGSPWRYREDTLFGKATQLLPVEASEYDKLGTASQAHVRAAADSMEIQPSAEANGILVRIPLQEGERCDWRVAAEGGVWEDTFRTRHPNHVGSHATNHHLRVGGNVLWDSRLWPLGGTPQTCNLAFATSRGENKLLFSAEDFDGVFLLDRIGDDHCPHVYFARKLGSYDLHHEAGAGIIRVVKMENEGNGKAPVDSRLVYGGGQWRFDNGSIQVWIARNGTLSQFKTRQPDGSYKTAINSSTLYTDAGYGNEQTVLYVTPNTSYNSNSEAEPFSRLERLPDGRLKLCFTGRLRGSYRFALLPRPIFYYYEYTFGDGDGFGLVCGVRPLKQPTGERAFLGWGLDLDTDVDHFDFMAGGKLVATARQEKNRSGATRQIADCPWIDDIICYAADKSVRFHFGDMTWHGQQPENIFNHNRRLFVAWHDGPVNGRGVSQWQLLSTYVSADKSSGKAPALPAHLMAIPALENVEGLLLRDTGFENVVENDWVGRLVESVSLTMPGQEWVLPPTASYDSAVKHSGKYSLRIIGEAGKYHNARQSVNMRQMTPGSRWRLSCWAKSEGLKPGPERWMLPLLRFLITDNGKVTFKGMRMPLEDFDWREFSCELEVPEGKQTYSVQLGMDGCLGTLWLDDVKLERLP